MSILTRVKEWVDNEVLEADDLNAEFNAIVDNIIAGTTESQGVLQLEDSHASTSTSKAACPKNVKESYDLADAAVPKSMYNAQSILQATTDNTPAVLTVGEQTVIGRITAGNIAALTPTQIRTLINVENAADVTDEANVTTALPVIDSTVIVKGSTTATKQMRFEVDGLTADTTRVLTVPDKNITIAGTDDLHAEAHNIASHSDTTATGAELNTLTGGGDTTLHDHDGITENTAARHIQGTDTALGTMAADIVMGTHKITGLAAGTDVGHSLRSTTYVGESVLDNIVSRCVVIKCIADDTALTTGNGKAHFTIPIELNSMNLVSVGAHVYYNSSSGTPTFMVHNLTDASDMLSTAITVDANEPDSATAATPAVINAAEDDVVTGDVIRIDCDVAGTNTKGMEIRLGFRTVA